MMDWGTINQNKYPTEPKGIKPSNYRQSFENSDSRINNPKWEISNKHPIGARTATSSVNNNIVSQAQKKMQFEGLSKAERTQVKNATCLAVPNEQNKMDTTGTNLTQVSGNERIQDYESQHIMRNVSNFNSIISEIKVGSYQFCFKNGLLTTNPNCGFRATIAYDKVEQKVYVHIIGTEFAPTKTGFETMAADIGIASGRQAAIFEIGVKLAQTMQDLFGDNCILSGHSLGGSVAQCACVHTGIKTITLNPAAVNKEFLKLESANEDSLIQARENCLQITLEGDLVSDNKLTFAKNDPTYETAQIASRKVILKNSNPSKFSLGMSEHFAATLNLAVKLQDSKLNLSEFEGVHFATIDY